MHSAEEQRGGTASRPHLTTAAALEAAIVDAAGRGPAALLCSAM